MQRAGSPVLWREEKVCRWEMLGVHVHHGSALCFQLCTEQRGADLQECWEAPTETCTKVSFSGGPSRCVPCSTPSFGYRCLPSTGKFFLNQNLVLS